MMHTSLDHLIQLFSKLPGLGKRSAERLVLHLIKKKELALYPLIEALQETAHNIHPCSFCGCLDVRDPCFICSDKNRDPSILCVVQDMSDLLAFERTGSFHGLYHVLGGVLSALEGVGPQDLNIQKLLSKVQKQKFDEIVLATNATLEGQTTFHYLRDLLIPSGIKVTRLAFGVPLGGELHYLDEGTLSTALKARQVQ
jgi:recombination protein RecR